MLYILAQNKVYGYKAVLEARGFKPISPIRIETALCAVSILILWLTRVQNERAKSVKLLP